MRGSGEDVGEDVGGEVTDWSDMVLEVVLEVVWGLGGLETWHGLQVGGVLVVSVQLDTNSWKERRLVTPFSGLVWLGD